MILSRVFIYIWKPMLIKIHYDTRIIDIIRVNCCRDIFTVSTCLDVCILNIIISGFF